MCTMKMRPRVIENVDPFFFRIKFGIKEDSYHQSSLSKKFRKHF